MSLAKEARILDPTLMAALPADIDQFPLISPPDIQGGIVESGQWKLYRESIAATKPQFDILGWWEGMNGCLPLMYPCARRILAIPHTSCDVERSFSVWKRARSDKQSI